MLMEIGEGCDGIKDEERLARTVFIVLVDPAKSQYVFRTSNTTDE